eukprot:671346-Prymnesium_polylepis.1
MAAGRRRWAAAREFRLDHAVAREHMDRAIRAGTSTQRSANRRRPGARCRGLAVDPRAVGECGFAGHVAL